MSLTYNQAVEQTITAGEQIHQIVNGTATTEVTVEDGSKVPSIRKALLDNFYFKDPIAWQVGQTENVFNQLRQFTDGSWWYAPSATASNPISMGSTPVGDSLWKIYDFDAIGKLTPQLREALRRSYAEAGFNLVDGSFEAGGTLVNANDVLLQERTGKVFSGPAGAVAAGTVPTSGGFVDRSDAGQVDTRVTVLPLYPNAIARSLHAKNADYFDASDFPSVQAAIDHLSILTAVEYGPTEYQGPNSPQYSSITRILRLQGRKIPVDAPVVLKGSVSIDGQGGGFIATSAFPAGEPILTQSSAPYSGCVYNVTIDGANRDVKGVLVTNAYHSKWDGIRVVCCANDGITYTGGFEFYLSNFEVVCANVPANPLVAGVRINGSDCQILNGALRYHPFGMWFEGGGNNRIGFVHSWGLYLYNKQKACFVIKNSANNKFTMCMADSPAKADWAKGNVEAVDGYINGGIGFYVDQGSAGTSFSHCTTYINETAYFVDAGLTYTNWLNPFRVVSDRVKIIDPEVVISSTVGPLKVTFDDVSAFDTAILIGVYDGIGNDFDRLGSRQEFAGYVRCPNAAFQIKAPTNISGSYTVNPESYKCIHLMRTGDASLSVANPPVCRDGTGTVEISLFIEKGVSPYTLSFDGTVVGRASEVNLNTNTTKLLRLQFISSVNKWLLTDVADYG